MWDDEAIVLKNFYGMGLPNPKYKKDRDKKVAAQIKEMGDKWCLAVQVERKDARG